MRFFIIEYTDNAGQKRVDVLANQADTHWTMKNLADPEKQIRATLQTPETKKEFLLLMNRIALAHENGREIPGEEI
jgi:hypothetical protein